MACKDTMNTEKLTFKCEPFYRATATAPSRPSNDLTYHTALKRR